LPLNPDQAVERYRTLGLAIEAAVFMDRWDEVDSLINERDGLLDLFSAKKVKLTPSAQTQLRACDQRLLQFLMGARSQTALDMRGSLESQQMRRAYRPAARPAAFDRAG
jgi:hypothetical protein